MGIERLVLLLDALNVVPDKVSESVDVYILSNTPDAATALVFADKLRDQCPGINIESHCGGGSFKSQIKKADKSGAQIALILGENEIAEQTIGVKYLRSEQPQEAVVQTELADLLHLYFTD